MSAEFKTWNEARDHAQREADRYRFSFGIEKPTPYQGWSVKMLPKPEFRFGWELRCEVVDPMPRPKPETLTDALDEYNERLEYGRAGGAR